MDGVVAHLELVSGGLSEMRQFGQHAVDWFTSTDDLTLGISELAAWAGADDVTPFSRRLFLPSTKRLILLYEVGADEGISDVGHHESPRQVPT
jgi:hypothetical protein